MPLRHPAPIVWAPAGCSDATDGAEAFPGAMASLSDLVPSLTTNHQWVARQAATQITSVFGGQVISAQIIIGDVIYGMVANGTGVDVPFAYNLATNSFLTVNGTLAANLPTSPPTSGDWIPPVMAQVGSRILVTHPGFSNAAINSAAKFIHIGNPTSGSVDLYGDYTMAQIGDTLIQQANIPPGTTVSSVTNGPLGQGTSCSGTLGQNTFTTGGTSGVTPAPGMALTSVGNIGVVGIITNVAGATVTYQTAAGGVAANPNTFTGATIFWGGSHIVMSAAATGTATNVNIKSFRVFAGGASYKFGWFDISSAGITLQATTSNGGPVISLASAFGLQPGMAVSGTGIPAATLLLNLTQPSLTFTATPPNFGDLTLTIQTTTSTSVPISGMTITGAGIIPGTSVAAVPNLTGFANGIFTVVIPLSQPAAGTVGLNTATYLFTGLVAGVLSNNATVTNTVTLTFNGGTPAVPLWGAGDTAYAPLPSLPVSVAQMAGRAYFACGINGFPFSDSLLPANRTFNTQAVVPSDGLAITALGPLFLSAPLTGGIVQAIIGFADSSRMYQITGDAALGNLSLNTMNVATGTRAPLSIIPCTLGLAFISPEGLRIVTFDGTISDPIGNPQNGAGISAPFMNASHPSRTVGAANSEVIRFTVTQGTAGDQEWVYYTSKKLWAGPNTFCYTQISPYKQSFVAHPLSVQGNGVTQGALYNANLVPAFPTTSTYIEAGFVMNWIYTTVLLPDNPEQDALGANEAAVWCASSNSHPLTITATDEIGVQLDQVTLTVPNVSPVSYIRMIPIDKQWVFRSVQVKITARSDANTTLGRLMIKYQKLGYQRYVP